MENQCTAITDNDIITSDLPRNLIISQKIGAVLETYKSIDIVVLNANSKIFRRNSFVSNKMNSNSKFEFFNVRTQKIGPKFSKTSF